MDRVNMVVLTEVLFILLGPCLVLALPTELILEAISLEDVGQTWPRWHVSFRIVGLQPRFHGQICKRLRLGIQAFQFSWDEPNRRSAFGSVFFETDQLCTWCDESDPLNISCDIPVADILCSSDGISISADLEADGSSQPMHFSMIEENISSSVACDSTHSARISSAQQAVFHDQVLSFSSLSRFQEVQAGEVLALDYSFSLPLAGKSSHFPLLAGCKLHLMVNGSIYTYDQPGNSGESNPFWSAHWPSVLVVLPEGKHEMGLQVQNVLGSVVLESAAVTIDLKYRVSATVSTHNCQISLLCRTLFELADALAVLNIEFTLLKYTALGFFLFDWFIPSRTFVPKGLHVPWYRVLHIGIAEEGGREQAVAVHFENALSEWSVWRQHGRLVLTHLQWKVKVDCTFLPVNGGHPADGGHGLEDVVSQTNKCDGSSSCKDGTQKVTQKVTFCSWCNNGMQDGLAESSRVTGSREAAGSGVTIHGRTFYLPVPITAYLLNEEWVDYQHGSLTVPWEVPQTISSLRRGEALLWRAFVAGKEQGLESPGERHIFSLLNAWKVNAEH